MFKKVSAIIVIMVLFSISLFIIEDQNNITGKSVEPDSLGPSQEEQNCLKECMGCKSFGVDCTGNEDQCMKKCGTEPEPQGKDEQCVSKCVTKNCEEYDFSCQNNYKNECDKECGMVKEPEAQNEEEQCIKDCINKIDPTLICSSGKSEGADEQGNEICQKCAEECVHLYDGPCLTDEKWQQKEEECMAQGLHMEASPMKGDSGEGYQCTIDIECIDRSDEWGDDPGTGPASYEKGHESKETNVVVEEKKSVFESIGDFFKGLFS